MNKQTLVLYYTFSVPSATVNTKVEKTGRGVAAVLGQSSNVAPIGKQNRGTDVGNAKLRFSVIGYLKIFNFLRYVKKPDTKLGYYGISSNEGYDQLVSYFF